MNVLIAGLGSIALKHVDAIRSLDPAAAIFALRSKKSEEVAGITNVYSIGELKAKPDFVIVSTPTHCHAETLRLCMTLGVPVMIEKPLFDRTEGMQELVAEIEASGLTTYVACNLRFHPVLAFVKEHLASTGRRINEANIYCGSWLPGWRPGRDFRTVYSANREMGGGVHIDLIHEPDYVYWLFGKPKEVTTLRRSVSSLEISSDDFAAYHFMYPGFTANISLNYFRRDAKRDLELVFEDETWHADLLACSITSSSGETVFSQPGYEIRQTYPAQVKYFTDHVANGTKPMNSIGEAFDILNICLNQA